MPKKKHKLNETESYDFGLIGIASPENDYRIIWTINKSFGIGFIRQDDLEIWHKLLDEPQTFHQFRFFNEETLITYRLLTNKCENGYLLEEMSNVDFLIKIDGEFDPGFIDKLVKDLNSLKEITLAFPLDASSLKSRKKLLE